MNKIKTSFRLSEETKKMLEYLIEKRYEELKEAE